MPHSRVNIFIDRLARGYHVTILELHSFGTLNPELTTNYNLDIVTKRTLLCKENRAKKKSSFNTVNRGQKLPLHTSHPFAPLSITNLRTPSQALKTRRLKPIQQKYKNRKEKKKIQHKSTTNISSIMCACILPNMNAETIISRFLFCQSWLVPVIAVQKTSQLVFSQ